MESIKLKNKILLVLVVIIIFVLPHFILIIYNFVGNKISVPGPQYSTYIGYITAPIAVVGTSLSTYIITRKSLKADIEHREKIWKVDIEHREKIWKDDIEHREKIWAEEKIEMRRNFQNEFETSKLIFGQYVVEKSEILRDLYIHAIEKYPWYNSNNKVHRTVNEYNQMVMDARVMTCKINVDIFNDDDFIDKFYKYCRHIIEDKKVKDFFIVYVLYCEHLKSLVKIAKDTTINLIEYDKMSRDLFALIKGGFDSLEEIKDYWSKVISMQ